MAKVTITLTEDIILNSVPNNARNCVVASLLKQVLKEELTPYATGSNTKVQLHSSEVREELTIVIPGPLRPIADQFDGLSLRTNTTLAAYKRRVDTFIEEAKDKSFTFQIEQRCLNQHTLKQLESQKN